MIQNTGVNTNSQYYASLAFMLDDINMGGNGNGEIADEVAAMIAQIPYGTVTPNETRCKYSNDIC